MKKLLLIALLAISFQSFGQGNWSLSSAKNRWANGMGFGNKDTSAYTNASDTNIVVLQYPGVLCYRHLTTDHWQIIASYTGSGFLPISDSLFNAGYTRRDHAQWMIDSLSNTISRGAGGGVIYYFNGGDSSTVSGYKSMSKSATVGTTVNFSLAGSGLLAQFVTAPGDPDATIIPSGVWRFEFDASVNTNGGTPQMYALVYYRHGSTNTLIGSTDTIPLTGGTTKSPYFTDFGMPQMSIDTSDRLVVQFYTYGTTTRIITLYTQDNNLAFVNTTFSAGISSLNNLTANSQLFAVDTTASGFSISSVAQTHTFKFPPLLKIVDTTGKWVANQYGQTLGPQPAKIWVSDTIKTSGVGGFRQIYTDTINGSDVLKVNQGVLIPNLYSYNVKSSGGSGVGIASMSASDSLNIGANGYPTIISGTGIYFRKLFGTYKTELPDKSGTIALTSDIPVSGTFTNRRIPFSNSLGQLKDTTGFTWDAGFLSIPGSAQAYGDIYTIGTGKGFYGQYLDIEDTAANTLALLYNSNINGAGIALQAGNNAAHPTLKLWGYNPLGTDSLLNFSPTGLYFYKPIVSTSTLTASSFSGAGTGLTGTASSLSIGGNAATATALGNSVTFNNGGSGDASGTTFNGSAARTISYNSIGASPLAGSSSLVTTGVLTSGSIASGFGSINIGSNSLTAGAIGGTTGNFSSSLIVNGGSTSLDFGGDYQIGLTVSRNGSSPNKNIAIGYNDALDFGFIGAVQNGIAWKNLVLAPIGGAVKIGATGTGDLYAGAISGTTGNFSGSVTASSFKLSSLNTAPSSASDTGTTGEIRWANGYVYLCVATNTWQRAALSTW